MSLAPSCGGGFDETNPYAKYIEPKAADGDAGEADNALEGTGDAEAEAALAATASRVAAGDQIAMVDQLVRNGEIDADTLRRASQAMQTSPEFFQAKADAVVQAMTKQAEAKMDAAGLVAEEVWQWAREHANADLEAAMKAHATDRSTRGYDKVAASYLASLSASDPDRLMAAQLGDGVRLSRVGDDVIVHARGATYKWASALKAGVIKVSKAR